MEVDINQSYIILNDNKKKHKHNIKMHQSNDLSQDSFESFVLVQDWLVRLLPFHGKKMMILWGLSS